MAFEKLGTIVHRVFQDAAKRNGEAARRDRISFVHGPAKVVFGNVTPIKPANMNRGAAHSNRGGQPRMRR
jgi:hypothetical protein